MKGMPLPFDFHGKGFLDLDLDLDLIVNKNITAAITTSFCIPDKYYNYSYFGEPTSVLDSAKIPSRPASSSTTLSSSLGGGGGASADTAGVAAVSDTNPSPGWPQESATATSSNAGGGGGESDLFPIPPPSLEIGTAAVEKFAMEDWESVLSESLAVSPSQEQSVLGWIMGDNNVDDPSMGSLNKVLQIGAPTPPELDFSAGFSAADQLTFPGDQFGNFHRSTADKIAQPPNPSNMNPNFKSPPYNLVPIPLPTQTSSESSLFFPMPFPHPQDHNFLASPQAKRHHPGGGEPHIARQPLQQHQPIPHNYPQHRPKFDELGQQQAIVDHLYKAAELVQAGNPVLAQGILARLNHHQLSPVVGKPFNRAAFYCKEALQLLLHNNNNLIINPSTPTLSPIGLIFKIAAYKSFSEASPIVHFSNFTCNQALLEAMEGFDTIHILDFDVGFGGQWASLMQELALRTGGAPTLKITAVSSPVASTNDQLELGLTRENLIQFAHEINVPFQFEVMSADLLSSMHFHASETEAVAVNLPVGSLANHELSLPLVLSFVKQLSPRIVVSVDRGCDRTDLPFANHVIHTLQAYSNLLESLDAGNVNSDAMQKIERLLVQPGIERIVLGRFRCPEKMQQHWRALFLSLGFSPVAFSNFAESQAECVVKRVPIRGFQVEKRQSSLVLCWQRKELISASAWRC